jgi:hypothetical protein
VYVVLNQQHSTDFNVNSETLSIKDSIDLLLHLQENVVCVRLYGLEAVLLADRFREFKLVQFQLAPYSVNIACIVSLDLCVNEALEYFRVSDLGVPVINHLVNKFIDHYKVFPHQLFLETPAEIMYHMSDLDKQLKHERS